MEYGVGAGNEFLLTILEPLSNPGDTDSASVGSLRSVYTLIINFSLCLRQRVEMGETLSCFVFSLIA